MIEWISNWAGGIVVAVIIGAVIEMILPSGNSKKYIKVVIGIYVLFTIVSPVIAKVTGETIEVSDILDLDKYVEEAEDIAVQNISQSDDQIMTVYYSGIKEDMKAKIKAKGYKVNEIDIGIAKDESYSITNITISVEKVDENETAKNDENTKEADTNKVESIENINKVEVTVTSDSAKLAMNSNENNLESENGSENLSQLSISEKKKLKEYLSSVYEVNENNITIY